MPLPAFDTPLIFETGQDGRANRYLPSGPALDTLRSLPAEPEFDLAFIDADKQNYPHYYDEVLTRLRPNGVILVDNVLWGGRVLDPKADDADTNAIRSFNDRVGSDDRVDTVMLPLGDGITIARKRD